MIHESDVSYKEFTMMMRSLYESLERLEGIIQDIKRIVEVKMTSINVDSTFRAEGAESFQSYLQWKDFLHKIKQATSDEEFNIWFRPITFVEYEDDTIYWEVPSIPFKEYLEANYPQLIRLALRDVYGPKVRLMYYIQDEYKGHTKKTAPESITLTYGI